MRMELSILQVSTTELTVTNMKLFKAPGVVVPNLQALRCWRSPRCHGHAGVLQCSICRQSDDLVEYLARGTLKPHYGSTDRGHRQRWSSQLRCFRLDLEDIEDLARPPRCRGTHDGGVDAAPLRETRKAGLWVSTRILFYAPTTLLLTGVGYCYPVSLVGGEHE